MEVNRADFLKAGGLTLGGLALGGVSALPHLETKGAEAPTSVVRVQAEDLVALNGGKINKVIDQNAGNGWALRLSARGTAMLESVLFTIPADQVRIRLRTISDSVGQNITPVGPNIALLVYAKRAVQAATYTQLYYDLPETAPIAAGTHTVALSATGGNEETIADWISFYSKTAPFTPKIALGTYAGNVQWQLDSTVIQPPATDIDKYTSLVGVAPKIIHVFQAMMDTPTRNKTHISINRDHNLGQLLDRYPNAAIMFSWEPRYLREPSTTDLTTPTTVSEIANDTKHDPYLQNMATEVFQVLSAKNRRLIIRLGHEMNIDQFPWGAGPNWENNPNITIKQADFIEAWRKIHGFFAAARANEYVEWCWCPNIQGPVVPGATDLHNWYPGDKYVDWLGLDGYNWGASTQGMGWYSPAQMFGPYSHSNGRFSDNLNNLMACDSTGSKSIIIAETGCHTQASKTALTGEKEQWFRDFRTYFKNAPEAARVKGIAYFHNDADGALWEIDKPPEALSPTIRDGERRGLPGPAACQELARRTTALGTLGFEPQSIRSTSESPYSALAAGCSARGES
jgi:hypothetical protein